MPDRKKEIDALIQEGVKKLDANRPPRCKKTVDGVQCEHSAVYAVHLKVNKTTDVKPRYLCEMHTQALNDECKELGPEFKLIIKKLS